jgi:replicative DNA helicase Mcm
MVDIDLDSEFNDFSNQNDIVIDEYLEILQDFLETVYKREIEHLASNYPDKKSLELDYKKLEAFDLNIAERLLENPYLILEAANSAIKKIDVGILESEINFEPKIRFFNLPEENRISIRDVGSEHLNKLVSIEGVIRLITERLEKMTSAHFICRKCSKSYNIIQKNQQIVKPVMCECRSREFDIDLEQSKFVDYQKIQIQEPLENLKGSEQASNIDIFLSEDLVNKCSAGDKIVVTGILKLKPPKGDSNIYNRYIVANNVEKTEHEFDELLINPEEEKQIKDLSKKDDVYELLSVSIAPNIYGHEIVKEAVVLQMFGGVKKKVGTQSLRGNIHVLLCGDPSTGKSKIIEYVDHLAPKSVYVAGKTTSGAGLTVSAVKDDFGEGGWTLKAGAVILASGGLAIIDEFDKMSVEDRSSLHEAMAQGTVSVSKAGLYAKFKADTSILAAANPKFNRFDKYKPAIEQIDLPFSLLSRFDLYFIIKDSLDRNLDLEVGSHIMKTHRSAEQLAQNEFKKSISSQELKDIENKILPKIDSDLFKKYVAYARQNIKPIMSKETAQKILDYYVELRDIGRKSNSFSATPRQLEGLIRLSEASARVKLKKEVDIEDAQRAIRIFKTSLEQTAMDLETGKIDIDIISTGQSTSERSYIKRILNIIRELTIDDKAINYNEIATYMESQNLNKDRLQESIRKLKKMGEIYEPKTGMYKVISSEMS